VQEKSHPHLVIIEKMKKKKLSVLFLNSGSSQKYNYLMNCRSNHETYYSNPTKRLDVIFVLCVAHKVHEVKSLKC